MNIHQDINFFYAHFIEFNARGCQYWHSQYTTATAEKNNLQILFPKHNFNSIDLHMINKKRYKNKGSTIIRIIMCLFRISLKIKKGYNQNV